MESQFESFAKVGRIFLSCKYKKGKKILTFAKLKNIKNSQQMTTQQKRFLLPENEIPTQWYNIVTDMKNKPLPMLHPGTKQAMKVEELYPLFAEELAKQELNTTDRFIDIPEEVREKYKFYRATPLVRAYGLEKALDTPAHIYFKNESVSPVGSHKLNSALAQAYYCKQQGVTNITTETGAGQWGTAMSYAAKAFGLELAVYMVKVSYEQKPYRRSVMQTFGSQVIASPSMSTKAGRKILTDHPTYQGSLGTAISEAIELAMQTPNCKYVLGSVLNHVTLHQTIIGLEAEKQMAMAGEYPDIIIGCFGGGSNFGGISFPFLRHKLIDNKDIRIIAAEPASCPKLTRGVFEYDFGDEAGYTPLLPMFTLGHDFAPAHIHAGGLRYHGAGSIVSQLKRDGLMEAVDIQQLDSFKAGILFAQTEGIVPAPESCHAIAATMIEAEKAKLEGKQKTILFNLSGHGLIDMAAYDAYLADDLSNYELSDEVIRRNVDKLENNLPTT
jgi:tryptophan synthase beta chain